ncbi:MAG: glycosyltransferase [Acholeplasmatales bacterium]|jgi:1-acyl-sn-glycerol-3-phosphate acyltransferase|nr:glycosyltransferase [Acholeplasmatales bacterium]
MKITFILDDFTTLSNGTVITAHRFRDELIRLGHEVKVVAIDVVGDDMFPLKEKYIPIVTEFSHKQDTHFSKPEKYTLAAAIYNSDVVHLFVCWKTEQKARKIAKQMGISCTSAFHVHPYNILFNIGLNKFKLFNDFLFWFWRKNFYNKIKTIHCPSKFAFDELKKHKYRAKLHVISNGYDPAFVKKEVTKDENYFTILMIGRFAKEKRNETLIKAILNSKYKEKIKIIFAGRGPRKKHLEKISSKLPNKPLFSFYTKEELVDVINKADLYVHAAEIEIEGISCIEALACGKVCLIAKSKYSATSQFAVDENCLFKVNDFLELRDKIDFLIEHEEYRLEYESKFLEESKYYKLEYCVSKMVEMFQEAIADNRTLLISEKSEKGKRMKKRVKRGAIKSMVSMIIYFALALPALAVNKIFYGLKIKGTHNVRKVLKKGLGAVSISNHVHNLDSTFAALAMFPKKPTFTSIPKNFELPIAGKLINVLGSVPIPLSKEESNVFFLELSSKLQKGELVHIFPEGELVAYDKELRPFRKGAFYLAYNAKVPIIPMIITYRYRKNKDKKPKITLIVSEPIYPNYKLLKDDQIADLKNRSTLKMKELESKYLK